MTDGPEQALRPKLRIFISYRHEGTSPYARQIYDAVAERYGNDHVFMDDDTLRLGEEFWNAISKALDECDVMLALIGRAWLARKQGKSRLDEPEDYVRRELEGALDRQTVIIPVLVQGVRMPKRGQLPPALAEIASRHAIELSDPRWRNDLQALIDGLDRIAREKAARSSTGPRVEDERNASTDPTSRRLEFLPPTMKTAPPRSDSRRRPRATTLVLSIASICVIAALSIVALRSTGASADRIETTPIPSASSIQDRRLLREMTGHVGPVFSIATATLNNNGKAVPVVVSGGSDESVRVWNLATGEPMANPATGIAIHPPANNYSPVLAVTTTVLKHADGESQPVAISSGDSNTLLVWDIATGKLIYPPLSGHQGLIRAITTGRLLDDRTVIISGSDDKSVRVWNLADGKPIGEPFVGNHASGISSVATTVWHGRPVVVSGSYDSTVQVSDMEMGTLIVASNPLPRPVYSVATASLVGQPVIVTGGGEKIVREWDLGDGVNINGSTLMEHADSVRTVTTSQLNGELVTISGSSDRSIRIWDLATGNPVTRPFTDPTMSAVLAVTTFEPKEAGDDNQPLMISAGADGAVRIWSI